MLPESDMDRALLVVTSQTDEEKIMIIKYIICEDGDDQVHPNVFNLSGHSNPTLGMIKKAFPVPGEYHFRFLSTLGNSKVWIDILDNNASLPSIDGGIFMKVSRLEKLTQSYKVNNTSTDITNNNPNQNITHKNPAINSSSNASKSDKLLSFESEDDNDSPQRLTQSNSFNDTSDLLGIDSPTNDISATKQQHAPIDLFGLDTLQQSANLSNKSMQSGNNFSSMPPRGMPINNSFDAFNNLQQFPPRGPPYQQRK